MAAERFFGYEDIVDLHRSGVLGHYKQSSNLDSIKMEDLDLDEYDKKDSKENELLKFDNFGAFIQPFEELQKGRDILKSKMETAKKSKLYLNALPSRRSKYDIAFFPYLELELLNYHLANQLPEEKRKIKLTPLKDGEELRNINYLFEIGLNHHLYNINSVYRIENPYLKSKFEKRINSSDNFYYLWHGTNTRNLVNLLRSGYSIDSKADKSGSMFGNGVYLTPFVHKASGYSGNNPTHDFGFNLGYTCEFGNLDSFTHERSKSGKAYLILNYVDLGRIYFPKKITTNINQKKYDSLWARAGKIKEGLSMDEIVIFDPSRILPVYLVEVSCSKE